MQRLLPEVLWQKNGLIPQYESLSSPPNYGLNSRINCALYLCVAARLGEGLYRIQTLEKGNGNQLHYIPQKVTKIHRY